MWAVSSLCWATIPLKISTSSLKSGIFEARVSTRLDMILF